MVSTANPTSNPASTSPSNPADQSAGDGRIADTRACRQRTIMRAAAAEGVWLGLVATLPVVAGRIAEAYMDLGVALPQATMALLRFGRAVDPASNVLPYAAMLAGVAMVSGALLVTAIIGSSEVRRASRFASTILLVVGILTWIAVAAILAIPYITMQQSLSA